MRAYLPFVGLALLVACASPAPPPASAPAPARPALYLPVAEELALGSPAARVAVVVVADFQCPYCRNLHRNLLPEMKARYVDSGLVRLYHKDFPLPTHRQAFAAAVAARCAARQGGLALMQDELYRVSALGPSAYGQAASDIGLDRAAFDACMQNPSVRAVINRDRMELRRLGVTATPTVILGHIKKNAVRIERMTKGVPTMAQISEEIEALLAR